MKPRGFHSGNARECQKKGVISRKDAKQKLWDFISSGAAGSYRDKLELLSRGKEISKPEQEFMDRAERMFPYVKARPKEEVDITSNGNQIQGVVLYLPKPNGVETLPQTGNSPSI